MRNDANQNSRERPRNYNAEMLEVIQQETARQKRPSLLLHSCCAPCSSSVLERLAPHFQISLLWFNPNIFPEEEFQKRLDAQRKLLRAMNLEESVKLIVTPWQNERYLERIQGLENEPEKGRRCEVCFRLRLEETARLAREGNYTYFCTTLTLSRHKNAPLINSIGEELALKYNIPWLPSEFRKQNGEKRTSEICIAFDIYRQHYCGCQFSLRVPEPSPIQPPTA